MPRKPAQKRRGSSKRSAKKRAQLQKKIAAVSLFVLSGLFLTGFVFYRRITIGYASAFSSSSYNILSEQIYTTALVKVNSFTDSPSKIEEITLIVLDKSTQKLVKYDVPADSQIDVPGRFGYEPFSNIYALGFFASNDATSSSELISRAIFKKFAFPVDRYLVVENEAYETVCGLFKGGLNIPTGDLDLIELKNSIKTNLSMREMFDIYSFTSSLPQDRIIEKTLGVSYDETPALLDEELRDITFDTEFSNELKTISILNGSEYSGIASLCSRAVKNIGGRVVAVGNSKKLYEKSVIITDDTSSISAQKISDMFGIEDVILKSSAQGYDESEILRSDITVILGVDFAETM